ncbi:MAG: hypothetical protein ACE5HF_09835 [Gemmatimonadota bacterium]
MEDLQLVRRVRAGDPAAERALYEAHVDRVFRLAYRMSGDERALDYLEAVLTDSP